MATNEPKKENPFVERYLKSMAEHYVDLEKSELERQTAGLPAPELSDSFYSRMDEIVRRLDAEDAKARKSSRRFKKRTALIAIAACAVMVAVTVGASFNLWGLPDRQDGDISTEWNYARHELPEGVKYLYLPKYLPEGYQETDYVPQGYLLTLVYSNFNDDTLPQITFTQHCKTDFFTIDAEEVQVENISIGKYSGQTYERDGNVVIVWNNSDYAFMLSSKLSAEELIKVGESLQKQT